MIVNSHAEYFRSMRENPLEKTPKVECYCQLPVGAQHLLRHHSRLLPVIFLHLVLEMSMR